MSMLRNHFEMIDLNPLVIDRQRATPPAHALEEERHATWYQITDNIKYIPGTKGSPLSYFGCFHDLADGLQTHVYAPAGLEIKGRWTLGGSLPGEPVQPVEIGLGIPAQGLWLREDVDMKCNILLTSFVRKTIKKSHAALVDKLVHKAHSSEAAASTERVEQLEQWSRSSLSSGPSLPQHPSRPNSLHSNSYAHSIGYHPSDRDSIISNQPSIGPNDPSLYQARPDPALYSAYKPLPPRPQATYETKREDHLRGLGYRAQQTQAPVELPAPDSIRKDNPAELAG
jgi:hypothetical protein